MTLDDIIKEWPHDTTHFSTTEGGYRKHVPEKCRRCQLESYAAREREWLKKLEGSIAKLTAIESHLVQSHQPCTANDLGGIHSELSALLAEKE